jgi:hypothetical protein
MGAGFLLRGAPRGGGVVGVVVAWRARADLGVPVVGVATREVAWWCGGAKMIS